MRSYLGGSVDNYTPLAYDLVCTVMVYHRPNGIHRSPGLYSLRFRLSGRR